MDLPIFINKRIFWETRLEDIDLQAHKNFVITRVFEWGHLAELKALLKYYSREEIVYGLTIQKYLSKRTLQFASALLNLPKEDFACYSPTPSHPHAWPI
jgi:hypothetical protein